jgi:hypothetical protein
MKNLLNFMLCFSLLLFVGNSVSAIDQDHSPPGIEMQYEMPEGVSVVVFNLESNANESVLTSAMILKMEIKRGGLYTLRLWRQDSKCIINNATITNSPCAFNHILYDMRLTNDYNQCTIQVNKHGVPGIETGYEQVSQLSLYV